MVCGGGDLRGEGEDGIGLLSAFIFLFYSLAF